MSQRNDERYQAAKKRIKPDAVQRHAKALFKDDQSPQERLDAQQKLRVKLGLRNGEDLSPYLPKGKA